jgi:hypothetical protein
MIRRDEMPGEVPGEAPSEAPDEVPSEAPDDMIRSDEPPGTPV